MPKTRVYGNMFIMYSWVLKTTHVISFFYPPPPHTHCHNQALRSKYFQVGQNLNTASQTTATTRPLQPIAQAQPGQNAKQHVFKKPSVSNIIKQQHLSQAKQAHLAREGGIQGDTRAPTPGRNDTISELGSSIEFVKSKEVGKSKLELNSSSFWDIENENKPLNDHGNLTRKHKDMHQSGIGQTSSKDNLISGMHKQQHRTLFNPVKVAPFKSKPSVVGYNGLHRTEGHARANDVGGVLGLTGAMHHEKKT